MPGIGIGIIKVQNSWVLTRLNSASDVIEWDTSQRIAEIAPHAAFQREAPRQTGSNPSPQTATLTAHPSLEEPTEEHLKELLAECRLPHENELL